MNNSTPEQVSQQEEWRDIPEWIQVYQVSNFGRVRSLTRLDYLGHPRKGKVLSPTLQHGYPAVVLSRNAQPVTYRIHILVARVFIGSCPEGCEINHINGIKTDARVTNLEYVTHTENMRHAVQTGLFRGLKPDQIDAILQERRSGKTLAEIGESFGVTKEAIRLICRKRGVKKHRFVSKA